MRRTSMTLLHLLASSLCLAPLLAAPAEAQPAFPAASLKIVNAFPPGGPSDIISRLVAEKLQASLKQPVIVENKPGAGGDLAADQVAKAPADGYTILTGIDTTFTVNPSIYRALPFKVEDLKPLMIMASSGLMVAVNPSLGVKTLAGLVAKGKTQTLSFSSGSNGSPGHLAAAILGDAAGIKVLHVPYKGNSPAVMALLSGEVQAGILATPGLLPHLQAGKITALAVTSRKRSLVAPDLPTVAEAGMKELEVEVLYVAMVPAATPEPVMVVLQKAMSDALMQPDVKAQLARLDLFVEAQTGKPAADRIDAQRARYARIIKATGMKIE
ncbi:MAG: tripartite tricarboxylate transporter substrate binding protein [Caldimonas sp.]|nr:tripartite tricarboxylate transporter substrate binding protein [Pseudomonadota bacterium]